MCLILFAHRADARYRLVLAANRDEYFARPAAPADYWADAPTVLGGRDLQKGGTWLGVTRAGRWAALTNFRDGTTPPPEARSRGELVAGFLRGNLSAAEYATTIAPALHRYHGFNLLVGDADSVHVLTHADPAPTVVSPGVHGLSNHRLDTPWPKVSRGRQALQAALRTNRNLEEELLGLLADPSLADDASLPSTGIPADWEKRLSAVFIRAPGYGTRASSVLIIGQDGTVSFRERSFNEAGSAIEDRMYRFCLPAAAALTG